MGGSIVTTAECPPKRFSAVMAPSRVSIVCPGSVTSRRFFGFNQLGTLMVLGGDAMGAITR